MYPGVWVQSLPLPAILFAARARARVLRIDIKTEELTKQLLKKEQEKTN